MAVKDINENPTILPKHKLVLDIQDGQCEADVVMKKFIDFIKNKDPSRFRSTIGILGKVLNCCKLYLYPFCFRAGLF